jgi:hypothetical protein
VKLQKKSFMAHFLYTNHTLQAERRISGMLNHCVMEEGCEAATSLQGVDT